MMFFNFFGAIPLLLPNVVWNLMSIVYIFRGEEYGYQFEMGWDHSLKEDHVHYKGNRTSDENDLYLTKEQSPCRIVNESVQIRIILTVVLGYLMRQVMKD